MPKKKKRTLKKGLKKIREKPQKTSKVKESRKVIKKK